MGRPKKITPESTALVECEVLKSDSALEGKKVGDIVLLESSLAETLESWSCVKINAEPEAESSEEKNDQ